MIKLKQLIKEIVTENEVIAGVVCYQNIKKQIYVARR